MWFHVALLCFALHVILFRVLSVCMICGFMKTEADVFMAHYLRFTMFYISTECSYPPKDNQINLTQSIWHKVVEVKTSDTNQRAFDEQNSRCGYDFGDQAVQLCLCLDSFLKPLTKCGFWGSVIVPIFLFNQGRAYDDEHGSYRGIFEN